VSNVPITILRNVIDALTNGKTDYQRVCIELAKVDPYLFLKLSGSLDARVECIISHYTKSINPNKITAIRDVRELDRSLGLKEAKEFVETVIEQYNLNPIKESN